MSPGRELIAALLLLVAGVASAQTPYAYPCMDETGDCLPAPGTPVPTLAPVDVDDVAPYEDLTTWMATALANVQALPDEITSQNGTDLLPSETGNQLWGYARWLGSPTTASELMGPLAPIGISMYVLMTAMMVGTGVYLTVRVVVLLVRVVQAIIIWILKLIPGFG
jgi:hypothetical protein